MLTINPAAVSMAARQYPEYVEANIEVTALDCRHPAGFLDGYVRLTPRFRLARLSASILRPSMSILAELSSSSSRLA